MKELVYVFFGGLIATSIANAAVPRSYNCALYRMPNGDEFHGELIADHILVDLSASSTNSVVIRGVPKLDEREQVEIAVKREEPKKVLFRLNYLYYSPLGEIYYQALTSKIRVDQVTKEVELSTYEVRSTSNPTGISISCISD